MPHQLTTLILSAIWVQLVLAAKLAYDLRLWYNREIKATSKKTVIHWKEWIVMAAACSPSIYYLKKFIHLHWALATIIAGAMCALWLWSWFDGLYNKFRGFNWFYTGSVDKDDPSTDKFLRKVGIAGQIIIKYCGFATAVYFFIKYSNF